MEPRIYLGQIAVFEKRQERDVQFLYLAALESHTNQRGGDGLGHRLQRMDRAALVVRMPVGMEVIELMHPGRVGASEAAADRSRAAAADLAIVARVAMVGDDPAIAHHVERVHIAVRPCAHVTIERREAVLRRLRTHESAREQDPGRYADELTVHGVSISQANH